MFQTSSDSSYALNYLSLSIILLAMFIFLNSIATPNEVKKTTGLQSIRNKFRAASTANSPGSSVNLADEGLAGALTELQSINTADLQFHRETNELIAAIPTTLLFRGSSGDISVDGSSMLLTLARTAIGHNALVELHFSKNETPNDLSWTQALLRGASIYRFFIDAGISETNLRMEVHGTSLRELTLLNLNICRRVPCAAFVLKNKNTDPLAVSPERTTTVSR